MTHNMPHHPIPRLLLGLVALAHLSACDDDGPAEEVVPADDAGSPADSAGPPPDSEPGDAASTDIGPEIVIEPGSLTVLADLNVESEPVPLTIRNQGTDPLEIFAIGFDPPPVDDAFALHDLPDVFPVEIAAGEHLTVGVTYRAPNRDPHRATVVITSNDNDEGEVAVTVTGGIRARCIRVSPWTVEMGSVEPGAQTGRFALALTNCGDLELTLVDIRIEGDARFQWTPAEGENPVGSTLDPRTTRSLLLWYVNEDLGAGETTSATLRIESNADEDSVLEVRLSARGGGGPSCIVSIQPERIDLGALRVGLTQSMTLELANSGTAACDLNEIAVERTSGPDENTFTLTTAPEVEQLAPQTTYAIEVLYAPAVADPRGDRAEVHVSYHDPHRDQNRRATAFLFAIGAEALVGAIPDALDFGEVTAPDCASWTLEVSAANVGFVPICLTGYHLEAPVPDADPCANFAWVDAPEIDECLALGADERAQFRLQYQPDEPLTDGCELVVESDAMNTQALRIPLTGDGVASSATSDEFIVGPLNPAQRAHFHLVRPALEETIAVELNGRLNVHWGFDEASNNLYFDRGNHPPRGATLNVEYEARCFDRRPVDGEDP